MVHGIDKIENGITRLSHPAKYQSTCFIRVDQRDQFRICFIPVDNVGNTQYGIQLCRTNIDLHKN